MRVCHAAYYNIGTAVVRNAIKKTEHEKGRRVFMNNGHLGSWGVVLRGGEVYRVYRV